MSETATAMERGARTATGEGLAFIAGFFFSARMIVVLVSVRIGIDSATGSALSLLLNLLLLLAVCFFTQGDARRSLRSLTAQSGVRWALAFLVVSCCSLAWSETVALTTSAVYWLALAADVATVLQLFRVGPIENVAHALMKGFVCSTCCLAVVAWLMPAQADLRLGDEDYFNANQIGNLCAFSIFLAQYLLRRKDGAWIPAIVLLSFTLFRSLSKTTIVAFVLGECLILLLDRTISRKTKYLLAVGAAFILLVFWSLFAAYYDVYTSNANQAETLTGRVGIWLYVLGTIVDHPWIGHGFDSMWKVIPPFGTFEARHAENDLLQQVYAYGALGAVLWIGVYGSLLRQMRGLPKGSRKALFLGILLFIFVRGFAEAEPFDLLLPLWFVVSMSLLAEHVQQDGRSSVAIH